MKKYIFLFIFPLSFVSAQSYFPENSSVKTTKSIYQAFTNDTIHVSEDIVIDNQLGSLKVGKDATLFISKGDALDMKTNILSNAFINGREISLETHHTEL